MNNQLRQLRMRPRDSSRQESAFFNQIGVVDQAERADDGIRADGASPVDPGAMTDEQRRNQLHLGRERDVVVDPDAVFPAGGSDADTRP